MDQDYEEPPATASPPASQLSGWGCLLPDDGGSSKEVRMEKVAAMAYLEWMGRGRSDAPQQSDQARSATRKVGK